MDESQRVIDYIKDVAEYVPTSDGRITASQMLERFLFPSSVQYNVIAKLSGGEKRRLYLCRILMEAPNVLMLDEPTNDLDIQTLTILEDYLDRFQGIVIAVSHDRYFLDRVARRIFAFEGEGKVRQYEGGFTDYQAAYERIHGKDEPDRTRESSQPAKGKTKEKPREKKLKFTYMEQKEWETIEDTIAALEEETAALEKEIEAAATDYERLKELMAQKEEKESLLEEKMDRWMYLNDLGGEDCGTTVLGGSMGDFYIAENRKWYPLGATRVRGGYHFATTAGEKSCALVLYRAGKTAPIQKISFREEDKTGDVWNMTLMGSDFQGLEYAYEADGILQADPYGTSFCGREKWGQPGTGEKKP